MSAQTTYSFDPKRGIAGGIADLSAYEINTFTSEDDLIAGIGVGFMTDGSIAKGMNFGRPFAGVVVNNRTRENSIYGGEMPTTIPAGEPFGVMRYGKTFVLVDDDSADLNIGQPAYVNQDGTFANTKTSSSTPVNAFFSSRAFAYEMPDEEGNPTSQLMAEVTLCNALAPIEMG